MQLPNAMALVGPLLLFLGGCQGLYLHNTERAAVAATAKKNVDAVDVPSITKTENQNLAKILAEEVKSIEARQKMVATLATIQLAASEESAAFQYRSAKEKMKLALGTDRVLEDMHKASQCRVNQKDAPDQVRTLSRTLERLAKLAQAPLQVPACEEALAKGITKPGGLSEDASEDFDNAAKEYLSQCTMVQAKCFITVGSKEAEQVAAARTKLDALQAQERAREKELKAAKEAYQSALDENKKKAGTHTKEEIQKRAQAVVDKANQAMKLSPTLADKVKGSALIELLTAAAGGKTDSTDPELAPALTIAREFPALAGSVEQAVQAHSMVPVSHLLLTLNDLAIQADRDARLAELYQEEIAFAEQKLGMRERQAELWRRYSDQLCNLIYLAEFDDYPRSSCDIDLPKKLPKPGDPLTCTIRTPYADGEKPADAKTDFKTVSSNDCILKRTWKSLLTEKLFKKNSGDKVEDSRQKRAVYEAAAAYLNVRLIAYETSVAEFRRIDVLHRRTVVTREAALLQWKNLVSVPVEELNGYYAGGAKPAEIADLIVKAVGFAAIAIGVAQ